MFRLSGLKKEIGLSKSTIRNRIKDGLLPPSISLAGKAQGWLDHEIKMVISALAAGKSNDDIKILVTELVKHRQFVPSSLRREFELDDPSTCAVNYWGKTNEQL